MSRIDELIQELCPAGVEYVDLGSMVRIRNGSDYKALGAGDVPVYGSGGVMTFVDTPVHDGPSVLIPRKGSLGNLFYVAEPFWTVDTIFYTEIDDSRLIPKFFYYVMFTQRLAEKNQAGGVPSMTQSYLKRLPIPVPPLAVQCEIVRVLDKFTLLEAELKSKLEAELEARRAQYQHYRDELVSANGGRRIRLADLGSFARGRRFTKNDVVEVGIPSLHYGEIYTVYGTSATQAVRHVRPELRDQLRFAQPGSVVFAGVGETVADVGKAVAWLGEEPIATHDDTFVFSSELNPKYVAYAVQTTDFHRQKDRYVSRAKVKRLSATGLGGIEIPVPSLEEQASIVRSLDKFDALVTDISTGLSAELAARRKQYEHYRDQLLTFKELAS